MKLSQIQLDTFDRDGYLFFPSLFKPAEIRALTDEVPAHYMDGVAAVEVSRATVPDPTFGDVYTMGECIPLDTGSDVVQSRVVLYYGSFLALASERPGFEWRAEAWETLTHELRHHLEWRARTDALEAYDWAAEQNFARQEGKAFDPVFHLSGEQVAPGLYKVDDDFFLDHVVRRPPSAAAVARKLPAASGYHEMKASPSRSQ